MKGSFVFSPGVDKYWAFPVWDKNKGWSHQNLKGEENYYGNMVETWS